MKTLTYIVTQALRFTDIRAMDVDNDETAEHKEQVNTRVAGLKKVEKGRGDARLLKVARDMIEDHRNRRYCAKGLYAGKFSGATRIHPRLLGLQS